MANPPSSVTYARVVAQFVQFVADDDDPGQEPNVIPMSGTVTIAPNLTVVPFPSATPNPFTAWQRPIPCTIDDEGYLLGPDGLTRGVTVISSDSPNPVGDFTYSVTVALDGAEGMSYTLFLAAGTETDLTTAIVVPPLSPTDLEIALASIYATQAGMIVSGTVNGSGQLVLTKANGTTEIAGTVVGPKGDPGDLIPYVSGSAWSGAINLSTFAFPVSTKRTLAGDVVLSLANRTAGSSTGSIVLELVQGAAGGYLVTWPDTVKWPYGFKPILPSGPGLATQYILEWTGVEWLGKVGASEYA